MNRNSRRAKLDNIAHVSETLRAAPIEAPDFTSSILDRVDVERPFLAPSVRRKLPWIRLGLGACVALSILSVALTHRYAPKAIQLTEQPAPVSDVVQCVECAASAKLMALRPAMLNVTEKDCSQLFAAMTAAADIAQNEGRRPAPGTDSPTTLAAILPLSQAVPLNTPAPPFPPTNAPIASLASNHSVSRQRAPAMYAQSILPDSGGPTMLMSADASRVRVVPTFLEHDLDGLVFPR